ncbi:MAG: 1-acyl-sn-glycerol-3-phosphate acyltransferase [bacterium]|nr:1-acyl-sn-glycerol-3-phosphate acyltransferase [bacterium]
MASPEDHGSAGTSTEEWEYRPSPGLDQNLLQRLGSFPREPEPLVYALRSAGALLLRAWLRIYHRLEIVGRENLPAEGSFVLVANHSSHLDALSLVSAFSLARLHRVFPAAAADYFFSNMAKTAFSAVFINALPFHREVNAEQSLSVCSTLLENPGNVLMIFPEGTRSTNGELNRFRSGVGRLLAGTDFSAVPCHLLGASAAWPKGRTIPMPKKVRVTIGTPRSYKSLPDTRETVHEICRDLEEAVRLLADDCHPR